MIDHAGGLPFEARGKEQNLQHQPQIMRRCGDRGVSYPQTTGCPEKRFAFLRLLSRDRRSSSARGQTSIAAHLSTLPDASTPPLSLSASVSGTLTNKLDDQAEMGLQVSHLPTPAPFIDGLQRLDRLGRRQPIGVSSLATNIFWVRRCSLVARHHAHRSTLDPSILPFARGRILYEQVGLHLHGGEVLHAVGEDVKEGLGLQRQAVEVRFILFAS